MKSAGAILAAVVATILAVVLVIAAIVGIYVGVKGISRTQKRADANNQVKVTAIQIRNQTQQAKVIAAKDAIVQAQADQRVIAAQGLAKAQKIVRSTLNPLYVQFEAIEAQKAIATSGRNNTVIYVPSGTNGTPVLTQDAATQAQGALGK